MRVPQKLRVLSKPQFPNNALAVNLLFLFNIKYIGESMHDYFERFREIYQQINLSHYDLTLWNICKLREAVV